MPRRKEELLAFLKNGLKIKTVMSESSETLSRAKCCNQINKFVDSRNASKSTDDTRTYNALAQSEHEQNSNAGDNNGKSKSTKVVKPTCFYEDIEIVLDKDEPTKSNVTVSTIDEQDPKSSHSGDKDTSNWAKKTEEFLMKLQNMEAYSAHEGRKNRKSKSQSRRSESSESPPQKKKTGEKTRSLKTRNSDIDEHLKNSEIKLRKISSTNYVSKKEIWETIQALKREVAKLEKKRYEMSSKSSKQNEKTISTALHIEQEMKSQIRDLLKVILEISEHNTKATAPLPVKSQEVGEAQDKTRAKHLSKSQTHKSPPRVKTSPRFSVTFDKSQLLPKDSENSHQESKDDFNASPDGRASSKEGSRARERDNPMAHAMSEGIKCATTMYLKANDFYDGGNLWCQTCNTLQRNILEFSQHLHSQEHIQKLGPDELDPSEETERLEINPKSAPARGDEFFKPVRAYNCLLCKCILNGSAKLRGHFTSRAHNLKFKEFLAANEDYEVPYLTQKMAVILRKELMKEGRTFSSSISGRTAAKH